MNIIETNLKFNELTYGNVPNKIILHNADASNCTIEDIHSWHLNNGWAGCGYHYFVRKNGTIYRGRPDNAIGSHCKGSNTGSIGICAEGAYNTESMPIAQKKAIIELGIYLKNKYGINKIYGHKELFSTDCPGNNYPLEEIKRGILSGKVEEVKKVKNIVIYNNDVDKRAAEYLADYLGCGTIAGRIPYDFSTIENVYGVGGGSFSTYAKVIKGTDRYDTIKAVLKFIGRL